MLQSSSHHSVTNHRDKIAKVYFDSIPSEFIEWVKRNESVSSSFPWLSECTNYVGKRPTGAPTVHVVVSTLTHKTSSIIATRPGNFGGAVPVPSSKKTSKTSAQVTSDASTENKASPSTARATTAAEQTSAGDIERTSAAPNLQNSATDSVASTVQQASSPTTSPQASSTAPRQIPSTGGESGQTTAVQQSTVQSSSAVDNIASPSEVQPTNTGNDGGTTSAANTVSDAAPRPSETTVAAGSEDGTQASSVVTIPTNGQIATSGGYTEPQQADATTTDRDSGPSTAPQGTYASQISSSEAAQSDRPVESSLVPQTTIVVAPVLTLGSSTIALNPSSEYIINSQTLAPGGPAITVGETTYSLAPSASAIIQNGQTQSLAPVVSVSIVPQITLGSSVITANPSNGFVYASQTISAGGPAVTTDGNTYSLATSGAMTYMVENGVTQQPATSQTAVPILTFGNSAVTANSDSVWVVGSQTLEAGGSAIVVGQATYSLATSGSSTLIVQNGITSALAVPTGSTTPIAPAITIGSNIITQNSASEYVIGDQTLAPGNSAIEVEGTTYSLAISSSATLLVENGVTATSTPATASSAEVHVIASVLAPKTTVEAGVVSQNTLSEYMVAGQTLSAGGSAVEVEGTTYSLAPSATAVFVDGVTSALPVASGSPVISVNTDAVAPAITVGSSVVIPNAATEYVIETQTLAPGSSAIEIQGTTYSLAPSASALLINGATNTLSASQATAIIIAGQTLSQGTEIQIQGTTYSLSPSGTSILINGTPSSLPTPPSAEQPLFAIGSTTLKPGEGVTVQGTIYSIPSSVSGNNEQPVVVVNGKTSTLPNTQGMGAAVISGLQRTSASEVAGSRVTGSVATTSIQGGESASGTQSTASTSTAGAERVVQRGAGNNFVALIMGVVGMVVL